MKFQAGLIALVVLLLAGCAGTPSLSLLGTAGQVAQVEVETELVGDPTQGEILFREGADGAPPCLACHALAPGGFGVGPVMAGIGERAGERVEGLDAETYIRESVLDPHALVVPGYRDLMYTEYGDHFTDQELADLVAYLLTL